MNTPEPQSILLIDDNKSFLDVLKMRLSDSGINIDYASSINEARTYFTKKFNVIVADYNLGDGVTGADIIRMYRTRYPYVRSIVYTRGTIDDISALEVDKIIQSENVGELIESIKLYCINEIEPQIIETIFAEINKIKVQMSAMQKSIKDMGDVKGAVELLQKNVGDFIKGHKNDAYKIIAAFGALEALRAIWEKVFQ
jgi:CheY-like chemotaxis protein